MVGSLQKRADDLNAQLTAANRKFLEAQSGSQQALQADSQRQLISTQLDAVLGQIDSLNTIDTSGGNLISDAGDNPIAVSPSKKIVLLTGGLLGLILGAIAAFVVNRRDDRIFEWRATRPFGGGELLAEIPSSDARLPSTGVDLDAFRTLRERLLSTSGPIVVAIDLTTGDQPSDMGSNLAVAFAESVPHVQLILPDYPAEFVRRLAADLRLERETDPDPAVEHPAITAYRSRAMKGLRVVALGSESPGDPSVSRIARMLHDAEGTDVVSIIALPPHGQSLAATRGRPARPLGAARRHAARHPGTHGQGAGRGARSRRRRRPRRCARAEGPAPRPRRGPRDGQLGLGEVRRSRQEPRRRR